jgi:hypothetical protein
MRKHKSEDKSKAVKVMGDTALLLGAVANSASQIDSAVVRLVAEGIRFAHACTKAETSANRMGVLRAANALLSFADKHSATPLPMVRAAENMGLALREYNANEYNRANLKAWNARDNVR